MGATLPDIDQGARERLTARFRTEVERWSEELPGRLENLAMRWRVQLEAAIPRGGVSAVFTCRLDDGRRAVLKVSPDRARIDFLIVLRRAVAHCAQDR